MRRFLCNPKYTYIYIIHKILRYKHLAAVLNTHIYIDFNLYTFEMKICPKIFNHEHELEKDELKLVT